MHDAPVFGSKFSDDDEFTVSEIAASRGLNPSTVRAWVRDGLLLARRDGRRWLVRAHDLEQMLQEHPGLGRPHGPSRQSAPSPVGEHASSTPPREGSHRHAVGILKKGLEL